MDLYGEQGPSGSWDTPLCLRSDGKVTQNFTSKFPGRRSARISLPAPHLVAHLPLRDEPWHLYIPILSRAHLEVWIRLFVSRERGSLGGSIRRRILLRDQVKWRTAGTETALPSPGPRRGKGGKNLVFRIERTP